MNNNIYTSNLLHYSGNNDKIIYKQKKLLTKLSNSLLDNQWIRIKNENIDIITEITNIKPYIKNNIGFKPSGVFLSKGEWLFHILCCHKDSYITLVEIDYSKIFRITNNKPNNYKIDKYYKNKLKIFNNNYVIYKNDCPYPLIEWSEIYNKYNGFAIYPYYINNFKDYFYLSTYDVSSLIVWNSNSIINEYKLTNNPLSSYLSYEDIDKYNIIIIKKTKFINYLIKKINKINNIIQK